MRGPITLVLHALEDMRDELRDAHQPELELGKRLVYIARHGAQALAKLGGDIAGAAAAAERDEARILLQASRDYTAQRMEELRQLRATSVELGAQLIGVTAERDQAVAAQAAAVAQAAEAAAVGLRRETELRQLQDEALRELRQKLAVALGERDAKDRAVDHQIGVLRQLRGDLADQSQRLVALTTDARALCLALLAEDSVEGPVLVGLDQLRRRLGEAP